MIDRSTWQKSLANKAQALGVSIKVDFPIGKNQLTEMRDAYSYIIDASGAPSVTSLYALSKSSSIVAGLVFGL